MLFHYRKNHGILLNMITGTGGYCMSTNVEKTKKSLFAGKKEKASQKKPKPEKKVTKIPKEKAVKTKTPKKARLTG